MSKAAAKQKAKTEERTAKPGRIAEAKAAVDEIKAEIDALESRIRESRAELARLSSQSSQRDADGVARAEALRTVIDNLQRDLPVKNWHTGDRRPLLQVRLERAEEELKDAYHMRANLELALLESEIQRLEWGDLLPSEAESQIQRMMVVFARIGFPAGTNERTWTACLAEMRQVQQNMDEGPRWRAALAECGPDPEIDDGDSWSRARTQLARECLDHARLELLRHRLRRARGMVYYQTTAEQGRLDELLRWLDRLEDGQFFEPD